MRKLAAIGFILLTAVLFSKPLYQLWDMSINVPLLSHTLLIPAVSLYLFWIRRKTIFSDLGHALVSGIGLMTLSLIMILYQKYRLSFFDQNDALFVSISSMVIWIAGGFLLIFGRRAFAQAKFPLLFLAFMVPMPSFILGPVVRFLQMGSTYAAQIILRIFDVPAYFEGVIIVLPGASVEVAEECSGIRSALALLILSTVGGYLFLNSNLRRLVLILCVIPVTIVKNGMRVATLALLGSYVDMSYLTDSALHNYGGKPFLILAIIMMLPVAWLLRRSERRNVTQRVDQERAPSATGKLNHSPNARSL